MVIRRAGPLRYLGFQVQSIISRGEWPITANATERSRKALTGTGPRGNREGVQREHPV